MSDTTTHPYLVKHVRLLWNNIYEVEIHPVNHGIACSSGQFCFVAFEGGKKRPYSIVQSDQTGTLILHIRMTETKINLWKKAENTNQGVEIEGPHGQLNSLGKGSLPRLIIAEGTGLAAFYWVITAPQSPSSKTQILWLRNSDDAGYMQKELSGWHEGTSNAHLQIMENRIGIDKCFSQDKPFAGEKEPYVIGFSGSEKSATYLRAAIAKGHLGEKVQFIADI